MVHANAAVFAHLGKVVLDQRDVFRFAIGRQTHHFVFATIDFESGVVSERAVEQSQAVGKTQFFQQSNFVATAYSNRTRRPFADTIDR